MLIIHDDGTGPIIEGAESPSLDSFTSMMNMGHSLSHGNNRTIGEAGTGLHEPVDQTTWPKAVSITANA